MSATLTRSNHLYPTSDGKPVAETDWHRQLMFELIDTLKLWFAADPQVYVSGNLLLFYEPSNRRKHVSPDVFVVRGVAKHNRLNFLTWEEGKGPDVVFELTSKTTSTEDVEQKFVLYRDVLKVKEFFLFDPTQDYLDPPQQGFRWTNGEYVPIEPTSDGKFVSEVLDLHWFRDHTSLRLFDPATKKVLPTSAELRQQETDRAEQEAARAQREAAHAKQETARAEYEAARANMLDEEVLRLRALLDEANKRQ